MSDLSPKSGRPIGRYVLTVVVVCLVSYAGLQYGYGDFPAWAYRVFGKTVSIDVVSGKEREQTWVFGIAIWDHVSENVLSTMLVELNLADDKSEAEWRTIAYAPYFGRDVFNGSERAWVIADCALDLPASRRKVILRDVQRMLKEHRIMELYDLLHQCKKEAIVQN